MKKDSKPTLFKATTESAEVIKTMINNEVGAEERKEKKMVEKEKK
ncbi:MAG: hypothetical protein ABH850_02075 [Candidatus Micrarchaeota archaeon]